jgi:divalent metal cation (Fe/Co/Zn/Cd) transporter
LTTRSLHLDKVDYKVAFGLSLFTILANLVEGVASTVLGFQDDTLALFGFGVDSFIEVISAVGIVIMILRILKNPNSTRNKYEISALRITGTGFYLLVTGLIITSIIKLINGSRPDTTVWGIIISLISLSVMIFLYFFKMRVGRRLNSEAIIADANCTKVCIYMSVVLLISSLAYSLFGFALMDIIGALGIAYFSFTEGREAFERAAEKVE